MDFNNVDDLKSNGFAGFKNIQYLYRDSSVIPKVRGVYLVLRNTLDSPEFLHPGCGGFFKGRDPNVDEEILQQNWVEGSKVVYIGKAGSLTGKATLNSRIRQYLRFGQGNNVGHYGGRLIWQIKNHNDLVFCWKKTPNHDPRVVEKMLISNFAENFGVRPFANLTG